MRALPRRSGGRRIKPAAAAGEHCILALAEGVQTDLHRSARAVVGIDRFFRSISPQRLFASRQRRRNYTPVYWGARTGC